ncbi:MAG: NADH-quinone oxidoreductase subunit M [Legionellales bacterium]|nr:NADH-quinone oxidoreductase subunit M [Legionellales bacterium]
MIPYLSLLTGLPILGAVLALGCQDREAWALRIAAGVTLISLVLCIPMVQGFDFSSSAFQFKELHEWIPAWNAKYAMGVDGITLPLIVLTVVTHAVIILTARTLVKAQFSKYLAVFLALQGVTIGVFSALDTLLFYCFWEGMLIPMYLCIGIWGGESRTQASIKFFLYTFIGSAFLLLSLVYIGLQAGGFSWAAAVKQPLSLMAQKWLFLGCLFAFAVKVPMWPVHTWLPDAHTEAPAAGSVILAALMLKVGAYGFFRFCLPILPDASRFFATPMLVLSLIAIVYIGLVALSQKDMKRLIAYSSVAHMGFVTLGCFGVYLITFNSGEMFAQMAMEGALMQMVAHAFGSGAMFLAFGLLYMQYHTRLIERFGGLAKVMPVFSACFMVFALTNVGLPGTAGFVGEFMVILGLFQGHAGVAALAALTLIISAAYTLWMFRRVFYGPIQHTAVTALQDVNGLSLGVLIFLVLMIFALGLFPEMVLGPAHASSAQLVQMALKSKLI